MITNELLEQADKNYQTFPAFEEWSKAIIDVSKWDKYSARLKQVITNSPELLKEAQEHIKRAAAIQTGMIEGLYEVDRGFTITATAEVAIWQAALNQKETTTRNLIEAQMKAYDHVLDFATQFTPIGEAYIRELHKVICAGQTTYKVHTPVGTQEHELPLGEYKKLSNHVLQADLKIHSYAPVDITGAEMHRLCQELNNQLFIDAHPILQASYIHYCLVVIHPFADGNGRIARALASIYTYRYNSIPLLIADDTKKEYFDSLESADHGEYQTFVNFIFERGIDSIRLLEESLKAAPKRSIEESAKEIQKLYVSKGGYQQSDIDKAGNTFFELFQKEMEKQLKQIRSPVISYNFQPVTSKSLKTPPKTEYRFPIEKGPRELHISLSTKQPATANLTNRFYLAVPKNSGQEDELLITCIENNEEIEARITEVFPLQTVSIEMRLTITVKRLLAEMTEKLLSQAKATLQKEGY